MHSDVGTVMVVGTFALALLVFIGGAVRELRNVRRGLYGSEPESRTTPPPLPGALAGAEASTVPAGAGNLPPVDPYAPGEVLPPPVSRQDPGPQGWWKVSSAIYNWYDLPMMGLLVLLYAAAPVAMLLMGGAPESGINVGTVVGTIVMQFFLTALVVGFVAWRKRPVEWLGLRWRQWPMTFVIAIAGVAITWVLLIFLNLVGYNKWLEGHIGADGRQEVVKAFGDADDPLLLALLCFTAVIVAPVTEEVLFRGYLYPASKRFLGRGAALAFTALVFAVAHANALALLPLVLLAVLLALAYELTGSLWAPIGLHMAFNGITVAMQLMMKWGIVPIPET